MSTLQEAKDLMSDTISYLEEAEQILDIEDDLEDLDFGSAIHEIELAESHLKELLRVLKSLDEEAANSSSGI